MTVDGNRGLVRSGLSILSGCVLVLHNDDVGGWMFNPFSELVDVSVGVHGFDDGGRCDFDDFRALDNGFQGNANGFSAAGENAGGVDVAVNRGVVWNTVLPSYLIRAAPAEKFVFDGFAVGVATDVAAAGVRTHRRAGFRLGWATSVATQATVELIVLWGPVSVCALRSALRLGDVFSLFSGARRLGLSGIERCWA
jgi:hypothetical protein